MHLRNEILSLRPDVFIHAGDLVGLGKKKIEFALELFTFPDCVHLAVPGNHDLWLPTGDSFSYYKALPSLYAEFGYHLLDGGPYLCGDVAFVGNIAWYDYSFAPAQLPPSKACSYEHKRLDGRVIWNDKMFVRLGMSDAEFNAYLLERLREDLAGLPQEVRRVIAVTHHVGFAEMASHKPDNRTWNFCSAFLGSQALGELLCAEPRITHHFCGHTHTEQRVERESCVSINIGSTYRAKRFELLEL